MSYNGWQNYETWLASLYFDGIDWRDFVETVLLGGEKDEEDKKVAMLAECLKDCVEDEVDAAGLDGFLNDLLNRAITKIDFTEIATAFLED